MPWFVKRNLTRCLAYRTLKQVITYSAGYPPPLMLNTFRIWDLNQDLASFNYSIVCGMVIGSIGLH